MITCFSAQLVLWQSIAEVFPDKMDCFLNIFIFTSKVTQHSLLMLNPELCLASSISSHQFLHEIIDIIFTRVQTPLAVWSCKSHLQHLYHPRRMMTCDQAVCSSSDRVCPLFPAWAPQNLGVNWHVCSAGSQGTRTPVRNIKPTTWQHSLFIDNFGFNCTVAWMVQDRELSSST